MSKLVSTVEKRASLLIKYRKLKVKKKEIPKWSASDLGFDKVDVMDLSDLYEPDLGVTDCDLMTGESLEEKGRNLAKKLLEEGVTLK